MVVVMCFYPNLILCVLFIVQRFWVLQKKALYKCNITLHYISICPQHMSNMCPQHMSNICTESGLVKPWVGKYVWNVQDEVDGWMFHIPLFNSQSKQFICMNKVHNDSLWIVRNLHQCMATTSMNDVLSVYLFWVNFTCCAPCNISFLVDPSFNYTMESNYFVIQGSW